MLAGRKGKKVTEYTHHILILIFIGFIVFTLDKKSAFFPVPMVLLIIGLGLSFLPYFEPLYLTKDIIFMFFLPALLFTSAYKFPIKSLKKNAITITMLGTIGLMATIAIFGLVIYFTAPAFVELSLVAAFLIASILAPTDPVSVTAILEKTSDDPNVSTIVEGESMINDGTSIVIFTIFSAMFVSGETFSIGSFAGEFLLVSAGGIVLGITAGWLVSKAVHWLHNHTYQVMLSLILAYGSFYIAEAAGVSGVLAVVSAGIFLSGTFSTIENEESLRSYLDGFWEVVEPVILSLIFLLIGIQAAEYLIFDQWIFAAILFIFSLLVRFVVVGGMLHNIFGYSSRFSWPSVSIITWSGMKGTMSVALLLSIEAAADSQADIIISLSFAAIVLSLIVQSIGEYPLTKKLENKS